MLYRKIQPYIESYLKSDSNKVLIIDGARQIGKTFIIRHVGQQLFENYIELNFAEDYNGPRLFEQVRTVKDFYFQVSTIAGERMGEKKNTLIFLDEIQAYPHLLTMLKFLKQDDRYTYIASGSLLGVTLKKTTSIPIGSIEIKRMFPLDFEEFLLANGFNRFAIDMMHEKFLTGESLDAAMHEKVMDLFKKYLLIGGLPDAVNSFIADTNIVKVRTIHRDIRAFYADDASKYEADNSRKLKIRRIYDMIPSNLESKKKRVVFQDIDAAKNKNNNGVVVYPTKQPYEELDQVGYWCLLNVLKAKDFQEFLGNSEAFDFYCEYAKFDFSRFDVSWLLNLYPHTLEQIAKNAKVKERVRVAIATTLDGEAIAPSDSQRLQSILVKHFC